MIGRHLVKSYSKQQRTIALSSAEAELHAMVAASSEAIGLIGLCRDMGLAVEGEVFCDSSAALGVAQRLGMGKLRHVRIQALWVQEVRCTKRLKYKKVLGSKNPADALTKHLGSELLMTHMIELGASSEEGRADIAPSIDDLSSYIEEWKADKKVQFASLVQIRPIPEVGKQRPTRTAKKTRAIISPCIGKSK